jgi:hypothetical protein
MAAGGFDSDMDMMDTSESVPAHDQPGIHAVPGVTGRIPTPIHCSFAAQVRGNSWNGGNAMLGDALATTPEEPNAAAFASNGLTDLAALHLNSASAAPIMTDWSVVQNRRLPSPISECGAEDSLGSGGRMALDLSVPHGHLSHVTHEHPLVAGLPPRASSAMDGRMVREGTPAGEMGMMDAESLGMGAGTTPSPKKGHTRSKHTLNTWTGLQPGMTRSFSIGYRADCEKCRMKMPGHFNHIIIS